MINKFLLLLNIFFSKNKIHTISVDNTTKVWIELEIGKMPPYIVKDYMDSYKTILKREFPNNEIILTTMRNGVSGCKIQLCDGLKIVTNEGQIS